MIGRNGNYKCDYCDGETGEFNTETGNHISCQSNVAKDAAIEAAKEALQAYAARENWWITHNEDGKADDAIWQEGDTDTEPWKIADAALAKLDALK